MSPALANKIKLKFWGVRGSIPTPGPKTIKYGGNTSCIEIAFPNEEIFVLDAGTGIRELGEYLVKLINPSKINIFISHFHWDHIQGLPFFVPLRNPEINLVIYGCEEPDSQIKNILSNQMDSTYFPIELTDLAAQISFKSLEQGKYLIGGVEVETKYINHPGYALAYKFSYEDKKIVFISDNEPFLDEKNISIDSGTSPVNKTESINELLPEEIEKMFNQFSESKTEKLIEYISDADFFIHDAQYTPQEYIERKKWGHSPYTYPIDLAIKAKVKKLLLYHHDPQHDDDFMDKIKIKAREYAQLRKGESLEIYIAREGDEYFI